MRKLKTRAIKMFKATSDALQTSKEADFIPRSDKVEDILTQVPEHEYVFIPILHSRHRVLWMKMRQTLTSLDVKVKSPTHFKIRSLTA